MSPLEKYIEGCLVDLRNAEHENRKLAYQDADPADHEEEFHRGVMVGVQRAIGEIESIRNLYKAGLK